MHHKDTQHKTEQSADWFHAILEYLYAQPMNGQWHDLRNIYGPTMPIHFDQKERRNGYERIRTVIAFLEEMKFLKYKGEVIKGMQSPTFLDVKGKHLDLGERPTFVDREEKVPLDLEGNENTLYWMAQLLPEGFAYLETRKSKIELHKSTLSTNRVIFYTYIILAIMTSVQASIAYVTWTEKTSREILVHKTYSPPKELYQLPQKEAGDSL